MSLSDAEIIATARKHFRPHANETPEVLAAYVASVRECLRAAEWRMPNEYPNSVTEAWGIEAEWGRYGQDRRYTARASLFTILTDHAPFTWDQVIRWRYVQTEFGEDVYST